LELHLAVIFYNGKLLSNSVQNQTPNMIAQSNPNVKYFLESFAIIKHPKNIIPVKTRNLKTKGLQADTHNP